MDTVIYNFILHILIKNYPAIFIVFTIGFVLYKLYKKADIYYLPKITEWEEISQLKDVRKPIEKNTNDIEDINKQFEEINKTFSKFVLKSDFENLDQKVDKLEEKIATVENNLVDKIAETERRLGNIVSDKVDNLYNKIIDLFRK